MQRRERLCLQTPGKGSLTRRALVHLTHGVTVRCRWKKCIRIPPFSGAGTSNKNQQMLLPHGSHIHFLLYLLAFGSAGPSTILMLGSWRDPPCRRLRTFHIPMRKSWIWQSNFPRPSICTMRRPSGTPSGA